MKKLLLLTALLVAATFSSCKYDDDDIWNSVHGLENRVAKLEELCKQMNTDISSLQTIVTALQNNDYVTGVTPVTQNGETIGYTITFTKSTPITIYHGQNGKDGANGTDGKDGVNGADGKDGHTPIIGVRQDADGIYYWTLDGEWLLDSSGNKIKAEGRDGQNGADGKDGVNGSDGKDGQDGQPGADGKDGITPQLKIENGYWFVSTDGGTTWTNLGKATGENGKDGQDGANGTDGKDGVDGDSIFKSVTQDDDNVYFTLADNTVITIAKQKGLTITFSQQKDIRIVAGGSIDINYTIVNGGSNPQIETVTTDGWKAVVKAESATTGTITVTSPAEETETPKVIVLASDGKGHTSMATLTFVYGMDPATELDIPDPNFKAYLLEVADMDGDGVLTYGDAEAYNQKPSDERRFDVNEKQIESLEGIQYFNIWGLYCINNQLTTLNVSKNTALTHLYCSQNKLTSLNVSNNTALTTLGCRRNLLTSLDVSKNIALTILECDYNQLTTLDTYNNITLTRLSCSRNKLTSLDVSNNTALGHLECGHNQLSTLDVSNCTSLITLNCSANPNLTKLYMRAGQTIENLDRPARTSIEYK